MAGPTNVEWHVPDNELQRDYLQQMQVFIAVCAIYCEKSQYLLFSAINREISRNTKVSKKIAIVSLFKIIFIDISYFQLLFIIY